jgi:hypothetical protein
MAVDEVMPLPNCSGLQSQVVPARGGGVKSASAFQIVSLAEAAWMYRRGRTLPVLFGVLFLDGMTPFSVQFSCNSGFISPVYQPRPMSGHLQWAKSLVMLILPAALHPSAQFMQFYLPFLVYSDKYHVTFVSVKKLYDTVDKPCSNNYTR